MISLNCPLSGGRLRQPVKSSACKHAKVFDAEPFLLMNQKSKKWQCPHCMKSLLLTDCEVDIFTLTILNKLKESGHEAIEEIEINKEGKWRPYRKGCKRSTEHWFECGGAFDPSLEGLATTGTTSAVAAAAAAAGGAKEGEKEGEKGPAAADAKGKEGEQGAGAGAADDGLNDDDDDSSEEELDEAEELRRAIAASGIKKRKKPEPEVIVISDDDDDDDMPLMAVRPAVPQQYKRPRTNATTSRFANVVPPGRQHIGFPQIPQNIPGIPLIQGNGNGPFMPGPPGHVITWPPPHWNNAAAPRHLQHQPMVRQQQQQQARGPTPRNPNPSIIELD